MCWKNYKVQGRKKYQEEIPFLFYRYQRLFLGSLMKRGRKLWAYNFLWRIKDGLKTRERIDFYWIFLFSLLNITPVVLLSYLKIGGLKQGVPMNISWKKKITFATKWIVKSLREKHKRLQLKDLLDELVASVYGRGLAQKQKRKTYAEAYANRFLLKRFKYRS